MNITIDASGATEALIRKALTTTPSLHEELMAETRRMLDAGAKIEDIVWMLEPGGGIADRRQELLADAPEEMKWLIRDLPPPRPGRMMVVYVGPEGLHAAHWASIHMAPKA